MRGFLKNSPIAFRIALIAIIPLIAVVVFASQSLMETYMTKTQMERLETLASLAPEVSDAVHELQKERGYSAGYISSGGTKFIGDLDSQRKLTDGAIKQLRSEAEKFPVDQYDPELSRSLTGALNDLEQLTAKRSAVSGKSLSVSEMASYYTAVISRLLSVVETMSLLTSDADLTRLIIAYTAFLEGKERAGIERAMGATGFSAGKFEPAVFRKFISLIAQQQTYFTQFVLLSPVTLKESLETALKSPASDTVDTMRAAAFKAAAENAPTDIDPAKWFAFSTERIEALKKVEDRIAGTLVADASAKLSSALDALWRGVGLVAAILVLTVVAVTLIIHNMTRSLNSTTADIERLASGDKSFDISGTDRRDEIGTIAKALLVFRDKMVEADRLSKLHEEAVRHREERAEHIEELNNRFDEGVSGVLETLASSATELNVSAETMNSTVDRSMQLSNTVASASEEATSNVETVAAAAAELSSSIAEITRQVHHSTAVVAKASEGAKESHAHVNGLHESAQRIGNVIKLIEEIAAQTHLLALNATIEAARAGEAGKGFAVVANEVKNLATQTARATEEIGDHVKAIQAETHSAVDSIEDIVKSVEEVSGVVASIASAVEQQNAATSEIARNVEEASSGTAQVSESIVGVTESSQEIGSASRQVLDATAELAKQSDVMRSLVNGFLTEVRAA